MERKVKYDYAFKLECIRLVLEKHISVNFVSKQKGLHHSNLCKWVLLYKAYGKPGLLSNKNQDYSVGFKLKVIQAIEKEHLSSSATRLKFNISSNFNYY